MDLNEIYTELWANSALAVYHPSLNNDGEPTLLAVARYSGNYQSVVEIELFSIAHPRAGRKDVHVVVREICLDFIKQEMNKGLE